VIQNYQSTLKIGIFLLIVFFFQSSFGQNRIDSTLEFDPNDTLVFTIVENMPAFVGGEKMLNNFLNSHYKGSCEEKVSSFIVEVDKDSSVGKVKCLSRGIESSGGSECDDEMANVLRQTSGKWIPGKQNGNPCNVYQIVTIRYISRKKVLVGIGIARQHIFDKH